MSYSYLAEGIGQAIVIAAVAGPLAWAVAGSTIEQPRDRHGRPEKQEKKQQ